jgi:protein phosphatase 2C
VVEDDELPEGEEAARSPCSMNSECSSVASADFEGVGLGFFGTEVEGARWFSRTRRPL